MKRNILHSIIWVIFGVQPIFSQNLTQYVNPFIGTGGHGHTFPGATTPFGMVQLSPDTRIDGSWDGCSGYHYSDSLIYGFSHTHLSGTGCSDYGDIAFMPSFTSALSDTFKRFKKLSYSFSHKNEKASAGYYSVVLDNGVKVELTATTRVGLQQYTYSKDGYAWITMNLEHRDELLEGKITAVSKRGFKGWRRSKAWARDQLLYYYFELSRDPEYYFIDGGDNNDYKINLRFKVKKGDKILVKTAISSVDEQGAMNNLKVELLHWDFNRVRQEADKSWNTELKRIKVYGGTQNEKVNFYTALYHCMIHPSVMSDADGRYRGRDKQVHKAEGFNYYTVFSLWDTHRALHPLLNIIDKKRSHDFIMTFNAQYEQSGRLPMWELWGNETNCMIGFHSVSVILDAYVHSVITKEELKAIYPAVKAEAMSDRFGLDKFRDKGYLEISDESESVSKTLEYSYDMWCASEIGYILNDTTADIFYRLSSGYMNVCDARTGFARPRKNGGWLNPFDPREVNNHFTEANSWQYSFAYPQNAGQVDQKLISSLFNADSRTTGREQSDITGLIGQYAHGNEPSHHIPYLFKNKDSAAKYVRKICSEFYKNDPGGLCGNEDCGQMSAWYVFSAMGFYPVCPGENKYCFGNMLFDSVKFMNGARYSTLKQKIADHNDAAINQKANIRYTSIEEGTPVIYFGHSTGRIIVKINDLIPSPVPIIEASGIVFNDSLFVKIRKNAKVKHPLPGQKNFNLADGFYYTVDGTEPQANSYFFPDSTEFTIRNSCIVKVGYGNRNSYPIWIRNVTTANFYKKPNNYSISILSQYNKQYTADGDEGLIDGLRGDLDWRKGRWQGYQGQDFEAVIDMKVAKPLNGLRVSASFLQDTRAWILFPNQVTFFGSMDGIYFEEISSQRNSVADTTMIVQTKEFGFDVWLDSTGKTYRYIKVKAINYGKLPTWHPGAGGDAFIFIDEIWIE